VIITSQTAVIDCSKVIT